jgi:hypothetical protein
MVLVLLDMVTSGQPLDTIVFAQDMEEIIANFQSALASKVMNKEFATHKELVQLLILVYVTHNIQEAIVIFLFALVKLILMHVLDQMELAILLVFVAAQLDMQEMNANTWFATEKIQMKLMSVMAKEFAKIQIAALVIHNTQEITVNFQNALVKLILMHVLDQMELAILLVFVTAQLDMQEMNANTWFATEKIQMTLMFVMAKEFAKIQIAALVIRNTQEITVISQNALD